jgi:hypothetical protein
MWFWMCTEMNNNAPILLLKPVSKETRLEQLWTEASGLVPEGARQQIGIASLNDQGTASFGSSGFTVSDLARLAKWVKHNLGDHPGLARLQNAELILLDTDTIVANIAIPVLWRNVPRLPVPGSLEEAALRLSRLKAGHNFWFWMTRSGPGERPYLVIGRQGRDPDGHRFAEQVNLQRRRSPVLGPSFEGVLRQGTDGSLIFTTSAETSKGVSILEALIAAEPELFAVLSKAMVVQTGDGRFVRSVRPGTAPKGSDLSRQAQLLESLEADHQVLFWLTSADATGQPMLLLEANRGDLQAAAQAAGGEGLTLRGQLHLSPRGWLELRSRKFWPEGMSILARWVEQHHAQWPALSRLHGVRMTQRNKEGKILNRHKDDALGQKIPSA